jgi:hypothetical protein
MTFLTEIKAVCNGSLLIVGSLAYSFLGVSVTSFQETAASMPIKQQLPHQGMERQARSVEGTAIWTRLLEQLVHPPTATKEQLVSRC